MKEILVQKLTSRKLWVSILGVIVGLATAFGIEENDYAQIVGAVTSALSAITYILGEAVIDRAAVQKNEGTDENA